MEIILINISSLASLPLLCEVAKYFIKNGHDIVFTSDNKIADFGRYADLLECRIVFFDDVVLRYQNSNLTQSKKRIFKHRKTKNRKVDVFLKDSREKYLAALKLLSDLNPKIIIVAEDGITSNFILLNAAKKMKIPILDCPFAFGSQKDLESSLEIKKQQNCLIQLQGEFSKIISKKYSHWVKKGAFSGCLMFPPEYIVALEKTGITIPNPWIIHGGVADKIAVESEKMYRHYIEESVSQAKLELVGSPYCDIMFDVLKADRELYYAYVNAREIKAGRRTILACWPPSFDDERGDGTEFANYEAMALDVLGFLAGLQGVEVIVSLHPAASKEMKTFLMSNGFDVSDAHVLELIPRCDIYFSCFSSTIRYAIACGKIVINYDMYQFNFCDYQNEAAVFTRNSFSEMKEVLSMLLDDNQYRRYANLQSHAAKQWGILDGGNFRRLEGCMANLEQKFKKGFRPFSLLRGVE